MESNKSDNISKDIGDKGDKKDLISSEIEELIAPIIDDEHLEPQEKTSKVISILNREVHFSGPIPHPSILAGYKELIPDAPERILRMAEQEVMHKIESENEIIKQNGIRDKGVITLNTRSQLFAFILIIILIAVGFCLTVMGYDIVGSVIFGTTIAGVATAFVVGKIRKSQEKKKDDKED